MFTYAIVCDLCRGTGQLLDCPQLCKPFNSPVDSDNSGVDNSEVSRLIRVCIGNLMHPVLHTLVYSSIGLQERKRDLISAASRNHRHAVIFTYPFVSIVPYIAPSWSSIILPLPISPCGWEFWGGPTNNVTHILLTKHLLVLRDMYIFSIAYLNSSWIMEKKGSWWSVSCLKGPS